MAGQGKDSKEKKGSKDDVGIVVRRLADEVAALRAEVAAVRAAPAPQTKALSPSSAPAITLNALLEGWEEDGHRSRILAADDTVVARLGYALSSPPKVALVRHLLDAGEQSAAQLGEKTGLTTGSLYHHLRELIHAEVVSSANRTRYALTERGRRATLLLFALASDE
jgi:DNA-binding HxlR family transcriptional regulator